MKIPKIEKLPSGSYRCRITIDGRTVSITDEDKRVVEQKVLALKSGAVAMAKHDGSLTLTQAIDEYIDMRKNTLSPATIRGYRTIQHNRFESIMCKKISSLTPQVCQKACDMEARIFSAKTLHNSWKFIQTVIKENTGEVISPRLPQMIKNERPFLSPEEVHVFVDAVKDTEVEIPALLALHSLRTSEIMGLTYSNIDFEKKAITVSGSVVKDERHQPVYKKTNKTAKSARTIPIFIPALASSLNAEAKKHKPSDRVIDTANITVYRRINRICEENNLPQVGIHGLRHSFASLAYSLGVPEMIAMQIGGWSDVNTMRKIYTHISEKQAQINVEKLANFFEKY